MVATAAKAAPASKLQLNCRSISIAATAAVATAAASAATATTSAVSTTTPTTPTAAAAISATATPTAAAAAAESTGPLFTRAGFVNGECPALVFLAVECRDGRGRFIIGVHFDKAEPLASTGFAVADDLCRGDGSMRREEFFQL
jgi:hypothetical protein